MNFRQLTKWSSAQIQSVSNPPLAMQRMNFALMARDMSWIYQFAGDTWFTTPGPDYSNSDMASDPGLLVLFAESVTVYP